MQVRKVLASLQRRNILVIVDTALMAGTSVVLLLGAARAMTALQLSDFSLIQLIVMTAVMLQRAVFLSPALASQRSVGRSVIPIRWAGQISLPAAVLLACFVSATIGSQGGAYVQWFLLGLGAGGIVLAQDTLRYCLLSRNLFRAAVLSDALWFILVALTLVFGQWLQTPAALTLYWTVAGLLAMVVALFGLRFYGRFPLDTRLMTIRHTWRLGKWSGADALMSATANLVPMLMTALVLGSEHAGVYRVLQSSLGPLNVLSTSLITMLGLDAWKYVSGSSLTLLRNTVRRAVMAMLIFACVYIVFAEVAVVVISGIDSPDLFRITLIVGFVGLLGAATAPLSAAALALGYQKHGAFLRIVIVGFSLVASFLGSYGNWLPWNDPIGTVSIFAAVTGLVGWAYSYQRAMKTERRILASANMP